MLLSQSAQDICAQLAKREQQVEMDMQLNSSLMQKVTRNVVVQGGMMDSRVVSALREIVQQPALIQPYLMTSIIGPVLRNILHELRATFAEGGR